MELLETDPAVIVSVGAVEGVLEQLLSDREVELGGDGADQLEELLLLHKSAAGLVEVAEGELTGLHEFLVVKSRSHL